MDISTDTSTSNIAAASSDMFTQSASKSRSTDFKCLFSYVYNELKNISEQLADPNTTSIVVGGQTLPDKSSPGTMFSITRYTNNLDNLNSMAMDLLTKKGSFEDQVSKMVG